MSVASKNLFAILGNDEEPEIPAPVKTVDKSSTHTAKRNTDGVAPSKTPAASGGRRGGVVSGNEAAFRDRNAGRDSNRGKPTDEVRGGRRGGFRGGRGKGDNDRHPHKAAPHGGSEKTAEQAWGSNKGDAELADTEAAQADAKKELTEAEKEAAAQAEAQAALEAEQEKYRTLDQFYAEKDNDDLKAKPIRKVDASAFAGAKPIENKLEDFVAPTTGKKERTRERKQKQFVELENRFIEPDRTSGGRGGRGGPRGGRPDGARGGRGDGAPRRGDGQRGGRGGPRGGAPRGGAPRKENAPINTSDEAAFPSLGA